MPPRFSVKFSASKRMNPDTSGPALPAITALKSAIPLCCAQTAVPPTNVNHGIVAPEVATIP